MKETEKVRALVLAAGGIVVRVGSQPLIAIVRVRRSKAWALPKGKLKAGEDTLAAAKREVLEETGHRVTVHEFLGSLSHAEDGRHKIVQFWRMQAVGGPVRKPMDDITAVKWLPLNQAIETLTRARERLFLAHVGPAAVRAARQAAREALARAAERASPAAVLREEEVATIDSEAPQPPIEPMTADLLAEVAAAEPEQPLLTESIAAIELPSVVAEASPTEDMPLDGDTSRPTREPFAAAVRAWIARQTQFLAGRHG